MICYFADRRMVILGLASTEIPQSLRISNDLESIEVENGVTTLSFTLHYKKDQINEVQNLSSIGNYVLMEDEEGRSKYYTIITKEHDRKERTIDLYCEDAGLDLLNEAVTAWGPPEKAQPIDYYIKKAIYDSGFEIGINELENLSRSLFWDGEATATERLLSIATQFDHAEIGFSFAVERMTVVHKYVDIYKKRGVDTQFQMRLGRDINNIIDNETIENLATALRVTGGTPEGSEVPIDLKGYKYDDGDIYTDGIYLKSRSGLAKWSRYLSESGTDEGHITVNYSYDTLTQSELCNRAITQLKKLCQVEINYEVDIVSLPKSIQIGDRINVIDEEGELYLEARILKLEKSRANKENKATLGDFLIKDSGISERLKQLADKVATIKSGDTYYPWVRYADDDKGNGFSATPLNKTYMAIKYGLNQPTPSDDLKDYLGLWVKIVGPEGQSIEGPPGTDGKTKYMWVAYADDVNGNGISIKQDGKMYLGLSYNQDTNIQSLKAKDYTWSAMYDKTALDAVNKRLNEVNSTTMSTIEPTDPKDNDNWWKIDSNNEVIGIYKFVDGKWVPSQIQQDNLIIKELISVAINSANITGSKIVNTFKDVQFEGAKLTGTTTIDGATIRIDFLTDSGQTGGVFINPFAIEGYINKLDGSRLNSYSLSSSNLSFTNGSLSGTLTAESLAPASWENLSLTSDATVSEGNTPFFRKIKNLDGSYSVELLGQVKKTSGNFSTSNTIIAQLPVNFRPGRTWMFMQADNVFKGARVSITDSGYIQIHSANNSGYVSLTGISFLQEK